MIYYGILILMTMLGAIASLFLKKASGEDSFFKILFRLELYIGGIIYILSAILNIYILRILDYSVVLPLTAITYIWTMIISYIVLHERITKKKITGVVLISIGAFLISM